MGSQTAPRFVVSRLPSDEDALPVYPSCEATQPMSNKLVKGTVVEGRAKPRITYGRVMLPIYPDGAVDTAFLDRVGTTRLDGQGVPHFSDSEYSTPHKHRSGTPGKK